MCLLAETTYQGLGAYVSSRSVARGYTVLSPQHTACARRLHFASPYPRALSVSSFSLSSQCNKKGIIITILVTS